MININDQIIDFIKSGEKKENVLKIGVEIEHFLIKNDDYTCIDYFGKNGIQKILEELSLIGYKCVYEGNNIIGLLSDDLSVTLEPGGQLEISLKPCDSIQEIEKIYIDFLKNIYNVINKRNISLINIGYVPNNYVQEINFIPKKRYEIMSEYFLNKGKYAHNMMKCTASIQVIIDYINEADYIKKFRTANFLTPLFYLITDNSPIFERKNYEKSCLRNIIWENTDKERCGIVPKVMDNLFNYKDYSNYLLEISPIFINKKKEFIKVFNKKNKEIISDINSQEELYHLFTMVFPNIRTKNYIEIRVADSLPKDILLGYLAFIKGIFYNENLLNEVYNYSLNKTNNDLNYLMNNIQEEGFNNYFFDYKISNYLAYLFNKVEKFLNNKEIFYLNKLKDLSLNNQNLSQLYKDKLKKNRLDVLKDLIVSF